MDKSNLDSPHLGSKNIFEGFYELIEEHRFNAEKDFELGNFYDHLSAFDLAYQEYNFRNNELSNKIVTKYLTDSLYSFFVLFKFKGFSDRPVFYAFKKFIQFYSLLLEKSDNVQSDFFFEKNISKNFPTLFEGDYINFLSKNDFNFNLLGTSNFDEYEYIISKAEYRIALDFGIPNPISVYLKDMEEETEEPEDFVKKEFYLFVTEFKIIEYHWDSENEKFIEIDFSYEMTLDIRIDTNDNDAQLQTEILFKILSSLSNINNVKLEFEHILKGSLIVRVRAYIKDLVAKEETKAVLETTKEALIKTATAGQVSHVETKKTSAETDKIKIEQKKIEKELESLPTNLESKISNALELEKKALENENLRIRNAKEKIEIIEKLSSLATAGILEADDLKIDINEILYILKSGDSIETTDTDIDKIT
ncbi:hypothetical protein [Aquimarina spongiae]|uniref:Uncharacterized protein n=1 Tax=Aquimarina spongiae TaxID=570521 RepID=A0A1M6CUY4_9FLAO|nr:hypothetical protein [Aquimarina spongiae]SHI64832.1 hypothetical protein SAMN04488508_102293 [Aquimarina spongiae]